MKLSFYFLYFYIYLVLKDRIENGSLEGKEVRERERESVCEVFAGMEGLRVTRRLEQKKKGRKKNISSYFGLGEDIVFCVHLILSVLETCMHAANLKHVLLDQMLVKMSPAVIED